MTYAHFVTGDNATQESEYRYRCYQRHF